MAAVNLTCHRCGIRFTPASRPAMPGLPPGPPPERLLPLPTCPDCHARKNLVRQSALGRYAVVLVFGALRGAHPDWAFHQCYHRGLHLIREALDRGAAAAPPVRVVLQDREVPAVAVFCGADLLGVAAVPGQVPDDE